MKLKAGRELDALVAEKVMGWKYNEEGQCWENEEGHCKWDNNQTKGSYKNFEPSTDIESAWEVVKALKASDRFCCITFRWPDFEDPEFELIQAGTEYNHDTKFYAVADTAPLAICLAALKAVSKEAEEPL